MSRPIHVIGVASGIGAANPETADGPDVIRAMGFLRELERVDGDFQWETTLHHRARPGEAAEEVVADLAATLAARVRTVAAAGGFPLVIGGDHSIAIGTWSGMRAALPAGQRLGLIWIDAHMDSHTFFTTPSRALHGMPLAALLGHGDAPLTGLSGFAPKLYPEDVCLIGVRSYESGEAALLTQLGVRIYFMPEVAERGLEAVFDEARARVNARSMGYGISLDLDAFDPGDLTGTGTPVAGGLRRDGLVARLRACRDDKRLMGLEIVEYNPYRDDHWRAAQAVAEICGALA